jgi:pimeloyl-ACP methyl ester carboxylesterase
MPSNDHRSANSVRESNRLCIITMVHGTWGGMQASSVWHALYRAARALYRAACTLFRAVPADPPWYDEGSLFRRRVESELRKENIAATFRIFQWSGGNSLRDRARAADELSSLLASDPDNANSIVISHSHGGNVALLAISKLGSRAATIHLITLATPFVRVFPTRRIAYLEELETLSFFLTIGFGIALLRKVVQVPEPLNRALGLLGPTDWLPDDVSDISLILVLLIWFLIAVVVGVVSYLLVHLFLNPSPRLGRIAEQIKMRAPRPLRIAKLEQLVEQIKVWGSRPFKIARLANYNTTGPPAPNLLVIRGVDDEAAFMLACGSIATAISHLAVRVLTSGRVVFLILFVGVGLGHTINRGLNNRGLSHFPDWFDQLFFQAGLFVLMGLICFSLLAPGLFNCVFGTEFAIGATRCEIAHDSTPDSTRTRIVTLKTPDQRLLPNGQDSTSSASNMHHRIYNYPSCALEIVRWINEHVR